MIRGEGSVSRTLFFVFRESDLVMRVPGLGVLVSSTRMHCFRMQSFRVSGPGFRVYLGRKVGGRVEVGCEGRV